MIYLDPRYSNYWLDQAREEQKKKQKEKKKKNDTKNNHIYDLLDAVINSKSNQKP
jgi:arabinogalactan endo-1,4-beta-galactosidase